MSKLRKSDVVAVMEPPGEAWRRIVATCWEAGAAILPVDARLPPPAVEALMLAARPTVAWTDSGIAPVEGGEPIEDDVALVMPTSGATGRPKLVELERAAVEAAITASSARLGADGSSSWLACLTPAHIGGLLVLLRGALLGATVEVSPRASLDEVTASDADFVSLVPTLLYRLVDVGADLRGFRAILIGGASLPDALRDEARAHGAHLVTTYGLTESCGGVVYDGLPLDGIDVAVVDGEVVLDGPTLMRGYRFGARRIGPLHTGDAGTLEDDRLAVHGRLDERIVSGGENIWPAEVEHVLREHPGVADVAVGGRADAEWGTVVVAHVVPRDTAAPPTLDDLRTFARARLPAFKAPRALILVDELPRTALGKLRRAELRSDR